MIERLDSRTVYDGKIASVRIDTVRYPDGSTHEREVVSHPGAVAVVAHDGAHLYMVRQPREAVGEDALLELPAGKLDIEGEPPLDCAKRELAEEVGLEASEWSLLKRIYTSPGFAEEEVNIFVATGLSEVERKKDPAEPIAIVRFALDELDRAIEQCVDAKSLVGLLLFKQERLRRKG